MKNKSKVSKLLLNKKKSLTVLLILFLFLVMIISVYSIYSANVFGNYNSYGTVVSYDEIPGVSTEGVVAIDIGTIDPMVGLRNEGENLTVLPETGYSENITISGGVSLLVRPGNCNPAGINGFVVSQGLAGYIYRYLSTGYSIFKSASWQFPPNFSIYQGGSVSYGQIPRSFFSSYSMKTQNRIYIIDAAGNQNYLTMVLSSPITVGYSSSFASASVSIQVDCYSATPYVPVITKTPTPTTNITTTPTPTLAPTCLPYCRP